SSDRKARAPHGTKKRMSAMAGAMVARSAVLVVEPAPYRCTMATISARAVSRSYARPDSARAPMAIATVTASHAETVIHLGTWTTRISLFPIVPGPGYRPE